jgi:hypothetical protein
LVGSTNDLKPDSLMELRRTKQTNKESKAGSARSH